MKNKIALLFLCGALFVGCKNEKLDANNLALKSNISEEVVQQAQSLDKASYVGLEHLFGDTENINSNGKFVLLIFGKNGCQWCERLKEEIKQNQKTQEMLKKDFQTYYINLSYSKLHHLDFNGKKSEEETSILARKYGIRSTPTSVFLDSDGEAIFGQSGYFSQEEMQMILEFIASEGYKKAKDQKEFLELLKARPKEVE